MKDFMLCQGDTKRINYVLPLNLSQKKVFFVFGDHQGHSKKIKCVAQSALSQEYKSLSQGGICIPFTAGDLEKSGLFSVQFLIIDMKGNQTTYPESGYLSMKIQGSLLGG